MKFNSEKALVAYAGITTAALVTLLLSGATNPQRTHFAEIDVQRINVREPDGTLRMTISNAARSPGIIVKGREQPHPSGRHKAGMLFFNDEGTETGGLIFGGREVDGRPVGGGSLTFDRYEQDQVVQLISAEDGTDRYSGMIVSDRPEERIDFAALEAARRMEPGPERQAAFAAANIGGETRAFIGRWTDRSSQVQLRDPEGRKRLVMSVDKDGNARIDFLDESGKIVRSISPEE
ncbi:MAG TPA: hypothetical protein VFI88_05005 [Sphingomicrobium sp.]|jgi:hypothetical protein|nr:hypothetical protein [Sphingomicrobium sp.]